MSAAPAKTAIIGFAISAFLISICAPNSRALAAPRGPQAASSSSSKSSAPKKKKTSSKKHSSKRQSFQKAPTAARISEIQTALARNGYYAGNPNGKWDSNTIGAMQKFQSANGLEANGKLNALSLQKLGLGSSIAGVSAPKQVPPASSVAPGSKPATPLPSTSAPASDNTSAASVAPQRQQ